jgi:hypothetical protein
LGYNNSIRQEHRCTNNTYKVEYTEGKTDEWLSKAYDSDTKKFCLKRKLDKFENAFTVRNTK